MRAGLTPDADGAFRERRERAVDAPATTTWTCVADLGGDPGWYAANRLWQVRGVLDRVVGGPGNRGRPDRELRVDDPVDGWRVETVEPGRSLTLVSEQRMPGTARMTYEVHDSQGPDTDRSRLVQRLEFRPDGRLGQTFWWVELPAHKVIFRAMLVRMAGEAERRARADGTMGP
ncbi:DUF2867 domain-containing protein [Ornithinimicrobium kibberense]|uniref:DUF2867 domain-containing protein n=1 Tax=Ornithinimicrobium kibberense TaxID=282060 RepID=A0ABV5V2R6_9MICO|nr:DUF2867 domain-containing protein [Ornithinimicrobium kibberense]